MRAEDDMRCPIVTAGSLEYLGSGAMQHVFACGAEVCKTPAVVDAVLPADAVAARAENLPRLIRELLVRQPFRMPAAAWLRRSRVQAFERMLTVLKEMEQSGCGDVLVPWKGTSFCGTLPLPGIGVRYSGSALQQRRVDLFFEDAELIELFDAKAMADAQVSMWRHGFALSDAAGAFGPDGWAILDGVLLLADTSSITRSLHVAVNTVSAAHREWALDRQKQRAPHHASDALESAQALIVEQITPSEILAHWCKGTSARGSTGGWLPHIRGLAAGLPEGDEPGHVKKYKGGR